MKNRTSTLTRRFVAPSLLAAALLLTVSRTNLSAQTAPDPAHAAHVAAGTMPPNMAMGDPALAQQITQLQAKVAQLESSLAQGAPPMAAASTNAAMPGMPPGAPATNPPMGMGMDKMAASGMPAMPTPPPPMAGMNAPAAPAGGMMGMMSQMMGMMDKMMSTGAANAPMPNSSAAPSGGMGTDMMNMPAPSSMALPTAMGGGMNMEKMEMAAMMGMGSMAASGPGTVSQSALPGFPGSSHLYHIGATGFFLDHPQHITLTTPQQAALNKAKEQATLAKSTADRAVEQAEQELWTLTAADQPDASAIQAKITVIGKLTGDARLSFIRAVGDASKLLTDEQRKILTGFAPPAPAAAPMPPMKGM